MEKVDTIKEQANKFTSKISDAYTNAKKLINRTFKPGEDNKKVDGRLKDKLKELLERIDRSDKHMDSALIPEEAQADFHSHVKRMVTEGFNDGVIGLRSESLRIFAKVKSEDMYLRYVATLAEKAKTLTNEILSKNKVVEDKMKQVKQHHDYQKYLQHHNKFNERGNTIWEFILYLFCFLVIFLADIPLAAEMLKRLFDTNMNSRPISLDTIRENWSAIITAVGISISTVYIKVCYDEFVARKYGHAVISKKKFEELFMEDSSLVRELDAKEKTLILRHDRIIRIVKVSLLIFTLSTIVMLGIFRGFAWLQKNGEGSVPVALISFTLIFITLLFSLISGVCLSLSLSALTTYKRLKNCRKESIDLEKTYLDATKDMATAEGKKAYVEKVAEKIGDGIEWKNSICQLLISYYDIGFDEGYSEPGYFMQHLDFFERVMLWREQAIAGKINAHINK